jgi:hypothetical protein
LPCNDAAEYRIDPAPIRGQWGSDDFDAVVIVWHAAFTETRRYGLCCFPDEIEQAAQVNGQTPGPHIGQPPVATYWPHNGTSRFTGIDERPVVGGRPSVHKAERVTAYGFRGSSGQCGPCRQNRCKRWARQTSSSALR